MNNNVVTFERDDLDSRVREAVRLNEQDLRSIEEAIKELDRSAEDERELKMGIIK